MKTGGVCVVQYGSIADFIFHRGCQERLTAPLRASRNDHCRCLPAGLEGWGRKEEGDFHMARQGDR